AAVAALGGVNHPPPHDAVLLNAGYYHLHRNPTFPGRSAVLGGRPAGAARPTLAGGARSVARPRAAGGSRTRRSHANITNEPDCSLEAHWRKPGVLPSALDTRAREQRASKGADSGPGIAGVTTGTRTGGGAARSGGATASREGRVRGCR